MKKKGKQEELENLITLAEEISGDIKYKIFRVNNVVLCGAVVITLLWVCFFLGLDEYGKLLLQIKKMWMRKLVLSEKKL